MFRESTVSIKSLNHFLGQNQLRRQVLFDISLQIESQEIVILTGPSGAGKTTLLTLIGGLRSVQNGSLRLLGKELRGASNQQLVKIRREIGYIFQSHNLLGFLTARQNVQMALEASENISDANAKSRSEAILRAVGLGQHLNHHPGELSGGQKQRVAIARALVCRPRLILADEPTASLDSQTGRDIIEIMSRLSKEHGCSILMVTHDNRILDIADRLLRIEDGRLAVGVKQPRAQPIGAR
ncbi:DevA family ABC transporter ATP-binding protein [Altericista sp. CCNU0014]|uniref:DevA family ABC transporter ATP-binding protein n=1 Tax=Altericista sp. CCNU0014 TaxID=3082949 RepID=UPI00384D7672